VTLTSQKLTVTFHTDVEHPREITFEKSLLPRCSRPNELNTTGIQKVRSLIQLATEYEHDILSLFNIVPFDRNAVGPVILQSLYAIVEEFLILVLQ